MKIHQKLRLGLGLLFALIILLAAVSLVYLRSLSDASHSILEANYNSLEYVRTMYAALDQEDLNDLDTVRFQGALEAQKQNITEFGERELTQQLERNFDLLIAARDRAVYFQRVRHDLHLIMTLNLQALERKSILAGKSSEIATRWVSGTASLCAIISLMMLLNLPRTITKPIRELLEGIREISAKNYRSRLHIDRRDEFKELGDSFNLLAIQLGEYYSSSISRIMIEKKRVETLVNNMHDPVIILDEDRKVIFVNDVASKILGLSREDLIGKSAVDIAVSNDLMRSLIQTDSHASDDSSHSKESLKIFTDNKESYFEKERQAMYFAAGADNLPQYMGDVIILRNITSFKEHDFAKSSFIATVSHELKTPISSIKLSLQLLEKKETGLLTEEQRQLVDSMEDDCTRLLKISSELLNMSQAETGNISLTLQPTDPAGIVQYALDATKTLADQRGIRFVPTLSESLPKVIADAEKVTWVMINFLTNAIRYSPEHSQVRVVVEPKDSGVEFSVIDVGKGIEERYREKIFDRYFQVPGSAKSGSGLGLAISKEFIESQGGRIGVESEIGYGSRFWFRLQQAS